VRLPPVLDVPLHELARRRTEQMFAIEIGPRQRERHDILELVAEAVRAAGLVESRSRPQPAAKRLIQQPAVQDQVERVIGCPDLDEVKHLVPTPPDVVGRCQGRGDGPVPPDKIGGVGVILPLTEQDEQVSGCGLLADWLRVQEGGKYCLLDLPGLWSEWGGTWAPDLVFFALGAVALAPLALRERAGQAAAQVIARQQPDGSWPGADLFHALEMLLMVPTAEARDAVRRAVPLACRLVQEGANLTGEAGAERGLLVLRAHALINGWS